MTHRQGDCASWAQLSLDLVRFASHSLSLQKIKDLPSGTLFILFQSKIKASLRQILSPYLLKHSMSKVFTDGMRKKTIMFRLWG